VWLFVSVLIALSVLGFANKADLQPSAPVAPPTPSPVTTAPPLPRDPPPNPGPTSVAAKPSDSLNSRPQASTSPVPGDPPTRLELAPAESEPESLSGGLTSVKCPLRRVAQVRGSDSEASEGGGFYAARKNGIHGAVDLNGSLGEAVFAVSDGKVVTAGAWGRLGNTVILDHQDGGYTIYGHLHTVDVKRNSVVAAGQVLGKIGYSGNARRLQAKNLPPHLHFAYFRGVSPLPRIKDSADGLGASFARDNGIPGSSGVLHPTWAVGFHKCWEEPALARRPG